MEISKTPSVATEEKAEEQKEEVEAHEGFNIRRYQGFWCPVEVLNGVISAQNHFQAEDSDIILACFPKSGTTWLKALAFTIVNRSRYSFADTPLLTNSPHDLVPFIEYDLFNQSPDLRPQRRFSESRILSTHIPHASLPQSILSSNCRVVCICRNPLDQFISEWQFLPRIRGSEPSLQHLGEAFERNCNGIHGFGPIWEHALGYWNASLEQPNKILFLKYEDLKDDINLYITKMADFLGCPFSEDEVSRGMVQEISKFCSFDNIKNLEVTKTGKLKTWGVENSLYLRKGKVGDWKNYLTPSRSQRLMKIVEEKLAGSGLTFKTSMEEPDDSK